MCIRESVKGVDKPMCANVDFYSGFVYRMLGIPQELFTPIFAMARIVGWCSHRIEEITTGGKIIRPAYKSAIKRLKYTPIDPVSYTHLDVYKRQGKPNAR